MTQIRYRSGPKYQLSDQSLPPHVSPEHQKLIDDMGLALKNYEKCLAGHILSARHPSLTDGIIPQWGYKEEARAMDDYNHDPLRLTMCRCLVDMRTMFESQQFMIKRSVSNAEEKRHADEADEERRNDDGR